MVSVPLCWCVRFASGPVMWAPTWMNAGLALLSRMMDYLLNYIDDFIVLWINDNNLTAHHKE
jgi:hypothetical protein